MTLNRDRHPEMLESGSQLEVSDILCIGAGGSHQAEDWCLSEPRASWLTKEGVPFRILWKLTPACMHRVLCLLHWRVTDPGNLPLEPRLMSLAYGCLSFSNRTTVFTALPSSQCVQTDELYLKCCDTLSGPWEGSVCVWCPGEGHPVL